MGPRLGPFRARPDMHSCPSCTPHARPSAQPKERHAPRALAADRTAAEGPPNAQTVHDAGHEGPPPRGLIPGSTLGRECQALLPSLVGLTPTRAGWSVRAIRASDRAEAGRQTHRSSSDIGEAVAAVRQLRVEDLQDGLQDPPAGQRTQKLVWHRPTLRSRCPNSTLCQDACGKSGVGSATPASGPSVRIGLWPAQVVATQRSTTMASSRSTDLAEDPRQDSSIDELLPTAAVLKTSSGRATGRERATWSQWPSRGLLNN